MNDYPSWKLRNFIMNLDQRNKKTEKDNRRTKQETVQRTLVEFQFDFGPENYIIEIQSKPSQEGIISLMFSLFHLSISLLRDVIDSDNSSFLSSSNTVTHAGVDAVVQFYTPPPPGPLFWCLAGLTGCFKGTLTAPTSHLYTHKASWCIEVEIPGLGSMWIWWVCCSSFSAAWLVWGLIQLLRKETLPPPAEEKYFSLEDVFFWCFLYLMHESSSKQQITLVLYVATLTSLCAAASLTFWLHFCCLFVHLLHRRRLVESEGLANTQEGFTSGSCLPDVDWSVKLDCEPKENKAIIYWGNSGE